MNVASHGERGPAVILWHSLFVDGGSWDAVIPKLAEGRRLFVVDGPGHGASPGPDRVFTLDECADAAEEIMFALGLEQVDWVGNAWGGHVGVVLAARGTKVRKLCVLASPMQAIAGKDRPKLAVMVELFRWFGPLGFLVSAVTDALLLPAARKTNPALDAYVAGALRRPSKRALYLAMRSVMLGRPSLVGRLGAVRAKTLFVGTHDDPTWPLALAREHAAIVPDGRFEALGGSRHLPPLEAPEETARLIGDFIG